MPHYQEGYENFSRKDGVLQKMYQNYGEKSAILTKATRKHAPSTVVWSAEMKVTVLGIECNSANF